MNLTYTDCNGDTKPLDKYHLHELLDRIHCVQNIVEEMLQNHPASGLTKDFLDDAQESLGHAYQEIGLIEHDYFGEKD